DPGRGKVALARPGTGCALPALVVPGGPAPAGKQKDDHGGGDKGNNRYQQARDAVTPTGALPFPVRRWRSGDGDHSTIAPLVLVPVGRPGVPRRPRRNGGCR